MIYYYILGEVFFFLWGIDVVGVFVLFDKEGVFFKCRGYEVIYFIFKNFLR